MVGDKVLNDQWEKNDNFLRLEGTKLDRVQWRIAFLLNGFDMRKKMVLNSG